MAPYMVNNIKVSLKFNTSEPSTTRKLKEFSRESAFVTKTSVNFFVLRYKFVYIVFHSGHINCTKIPSITEIDNSIENIQKLLPWLIIDTDYIIDNISANGCLTDKYLNLFKFSTFLKTSIQSHHFNPQQFPGLYTKYKDVTYIIFSSGRFVAVGSKSLDQLNESYVLFFNNVKHYLPAVSYDKQK